MASKPIAFLCHANDDEELARRIAEDLQRAGIDTFFDGWSIGIGESIRQRIDQGLGECTHFVVLLTETSLGRPWVNVEIDGAFVRKIEGTCRFLPLRHNLAVDRLPPSLKALRVPQLTNYDQDILSLVGEIYEISRKPPLGERPSFTLPAVKRPTGLSIAAAKIASEIVTKSERGRAGDPKIKVEYLMASTGLGEQDFEAAVDEFEHRRLVKPVRALGCPPFGYFAIESTKVTFIELDPVFMGWNPRADAVRLATELLNGGQRSLSARDASASLDWPPRRLNPALTFLVRQGLVLESRSIDPTFVSSWIQKNNRTLGFVRDRS